MAGEMMTDESRRFRWAVTGESYHEGCADPWRSEHHEGEISAEHAAEALEQIIMGPESQTGRTNDTLPWDLIDGDREITITIRPSEME